MLDLEFRLRATRPERFQALQFRDVGDSVLYHSLFGLASHNRLLSQLSAMASIGLSGVLLNGIPGP
jgi:hypothetical protein